MTKIEALENIYLTAQSQRRTKTTFARDKEALKVLGFTGSDEVEALKLLDYYKADGKPLYEFLTGEGEAKELLGEKTPCTTSLTVLNDDGEDTATGVPYPSYRRWMR